MTALTDAEWDAEIDARGAYAGDLFPDALPSWIKRSVWQALGLAAHARPYSPLRERTIHDPAYRPRHMNHRSEVGGE